MTKLDKVSDEEFREIIKNSSGFSEVRRQLGYSTNGRSPTDLIKERMNRLNIDYSHFNQTNSKSVAYDDITSVLCQHSPYKNIPSLKRRLIKQGHLINKCYICNMQPIWNNKPLVLQLDHINGIHDDNRIQNLRLVCPNCHSQTETFAGKGQCRTKQE